jgi:peptide deformylase
MLGGSAIFNGFQRAVGFQSRAAMFRTPPKSLACRTFSTSASRKVDSRLFGDLKEEVDPGKVEGVEFEFVKYPHPALRAENSEVTKEDLKDGSVQKLSKDMFKYMYEAAGVGLAAPQVGVNKRLMVYNASGDKKKWLDEVVLVNPRIVEFSEGTETDIEGCLSFPDMNGDVERSKWIKVEATNLRGKKVKRKYEGWEARIFQHGKQGIETFSEASQHALLKPTLV